MERRVRQRHRALREANMEDFGKEAYTEFERMAKLSLPPWPIRQCTARSKTTHERCRTKISQPGQILCRWHFGTTKNNRRVAARRFAIWVLCGLPVEEEGLLELLLAESVEKLLSEKPFYEASLEAQMRFLSSLMQMSGILDLGEDPL